MSSKYKYEMNTPWWQIWVVFALVIAALMLHGCTSEKHVMKGVSKGLAYYPIQTVQKVRLFAPCITTDHTFSTDSSGYKNSIDSLTATKAFYEALITGLGTAIEHDPKDDSICNKYLQEIDRLNKLHQYDSDYIINLTDDFNHIQPVVVRDTFRIEDKGKIMELNVKVQQLEKENNTYKTDLKISEDKNKKLQSRCNKLYLSLAGILLLIAGLAYLRFKTKGINSAKKVIGL